MTFCFVGNFATTSVGENEIAASLEKLGHKVVRLQERVCTIAQIKEAIESEKCDLLLFSKFRVADSVRKRRIFLEEINIPTVCWLFDLYYGL